MTSYKKSCGRKGEVEKGKWHSLNACYLLSVLTKSFPVGYLMQQNTTWMTTTCPLVNMSWSTYFLSGFSSFPQIHHLFAGEVGPTPWPVLLKTCLRLPIPGISHIWRENARSWGSGPGVQAPERWEARDYVGNSLQGNCILVSDGLFEI